MDTIHKVTEQTNSFIGRLMRAPSIDDSLSTMGVSQMFP